MKSRRFIKLNRRLKKAKKNIRLSRKGLLVDALASKGEEGRANLRKVSASWKEALTRKYPNGETH